MYCGRNYTSATLSYSSHVESTTFLAIISIVSSSIIGDVIVRERKNGAEMHHHK